MLEINQRPIRDLRRLIELIGQRRVELALDVHRTTVARWLAGTVRLPGAQLLAVRGLLGVLRRLSQLAVARGTLAVLRHQVSREGQQLTEVSERALVDRRARLQQILRQRSLSQWRGRGATRQC